MIILTGLGIFSIVSLFAVLQWYWCLVCTLPFYMISVYTVINFGLLNREYVPHGIV
jgi:hypothetical protein